MVTSGRRRPLVTAPGGSSRSWVRAMASKKRPAAAVSSRPAAVEGAVERCRVLCLKDLDFSGDTDAQSAEWEVVLPADHDAIRRMGHG
eukprot:Skav208667  [mRNA]  locus=scaffold3341:116502:117963:+ [translate_table: standard]